MCKMAVTGEEFVVEIDIGEGEMSPTVDDIVDNSCSEEEMTEDTGESIRELLSRLERSKPCNHGNDGNSEKSKSPSAQSSSADVEQELDFPIPSDQDDPPSDREGFDADSSLSDNEYYEVESDTNEEIEHDILRFPCVQYSRDSETPEDIANSWTASETGSSAGPFLGCSSLNLDPDKRQPEDFFNALFDERMFTVIAEQTNLYAQQKIRMARQNQDSIESMVNGTQKKHSRSHRWKDIIGADVKVFLGHVIVMGLVRKSCLEKYWSQTDITAVPFFGKLLARDKFESILSNLHLTNNEDVTNEEDPLHKMRNFITMLQDNFKFVYKPQRHISLDEASCPFKGDCLFIQLDDTLAY